jgi:hypothetical protein
VFGAVLALNGVYAPHRMIKWQGHLIGELDVLPEQFAERLRLLWTSGTAQALREAETLITDTVQLVQARTDADISPFCEELSQRRRPVDPPSAEHRPAPPQRLAPRWSRQPHGHKANARNCGDVRLDHAR